jgi:tetratricopeptide (TPR) repeat protein
MNSTSLGAPRFKIKTVLLLVLSATPCFLQVRAATQDPASAMEMAKKMQQEAASAELQVTLGGNLKDFSITTGESGSPASQLVRQSQVSAAIEVYREMLKTDSGNAELHFDLSLALAKLHDSRGSQEELETAIRLNANLAKARNRLGLLHMLNGEKAKAEDEFKAAISADSQFVEARNNLGVLFAWTGKSRESIELFRQAIQSRPDYAPARVNLGLVLAGEGNYAEAETEIRKALRSSANNPGAYSALAMIVSKRGRGDEAIELLRKVVQIQPTSPFAHLNLGTALSSDGFDLPGALEQFTEAIRLDPKAASAYYNKGRILYELNRFEESRVELDTACQLQPDYIDALYLFAQVEKKLGNVPRSAEILTHLVTLEPGNSDAQLLLGRNLLLLGRMDESVHHLKIAVALNPNDEDAFYNLAQALTRMGKPEAKVFLERFQILKQQREVNDRIQKLGSYGLEAAKARDWPQAVKNFKEAIELCDPCASAEDLHRNLGLIYVLKGDVEQGKQELEAALKIKPDDADARRALESLRGQHKAPD